MKRRSIFFLLATVHIVCSLKHACAQDSNGQNVARIVYLQDVPTPNSQNLESALEALRRETQQLNRTLAATQENELPVELRTSSVSDLQITEQLPTPLRTNPVFPTEASTEVGNTQDIYERIDLLKRIYQQKDAAPLMKSVESLAPHTTGQNPATTQHSTGLNSTQNQNPMELQAAPITPQDSAASVRENFDAERIFPDPVDLFELGNSLYQTGKIQTALEAYRQVDRETITASESVWVDFMTASCHRRLGNWDDARNLYRDVANQKIAPQLTKPAQGWLSQLDLQSRSRSTFSQIDAQLNSIMEKAKSHVEE